jgi:hypothetical protein
LPNCIEINLDSRCETNVYKRDTISKLETNENREIYIHFLNKIWKKTPILRFSGIFSAAGESDISMRRDGFKLLTTRRCESH